MSRTNELRTAKSEQIAANMESGYFTREKAITEWRALGFTTSEAEDMAEYVESTMEDEPK